MKYFTMQEMCHSNTADALEIYNWPQSDDIFENLNALVDNILDPAREKLGKPIIVNSGFRSWQTNTAVKGAKNSQHMRGQAADIRCSDLNRLWEIIGELPYDQRIFYKSKKFIHVSFKRDGNNRHETIYH